MFLHAWKLQVPHPITGAPLRLEAPLPPELVEVLGRANLAAPPGAATRDAPGGKRN
jgi:23S rRNA pseudouridine955/2504/2580 synthase